MKTPPNPHAAEARAAMQAHMSEVRGAAFVELLNRCWKKWPDLRRYADTARIDTAYDTKRAGWREVVTVTVFVAEEEPIVEQSTQTKGRLTYGESATAAAQADPLRGGE